MRKRGRQSRQTGSEDARELDMTGDRVWVEGSEEDGGGGRVHDFDEE